MPLTDFQIRRLLDQMGEDVPNDASELERSFALAWAIMRDAKGAGASVETDDLGQVIIYTGCEYLPDTTALVPMEEDEDSE